jgi:hypothetical protein
MRCATGVAALVLAVGCARSLDELEPYPCAASTPRCPSGRACVDGACRPASLDQPCDDFVDCSLGTADATCVGGACKFDTTLEWTCAPGLCALPCTQGGCPPGHTCDPALSVCLLDCVDACPARSSCRALAAQHACYPDPA